MPHDLELPRMHQEADFSLYHLARGKRTEEGGIKELNCLMNKGPSMRRRTVT